MLCQDCKKRSSCTKLCAEAELFINQDCCFDKSVFCDVDKVVKPYTWGSSASNNKLIYELYFLDRKSIRYISCYINLSVRRIQQIVHKFRSGIEEFSGMRSKILFAHFSELESNKGKIASSLAVTDRYVQAVIRDYLMEMGVIAK